MDHYGSQNLDFRFGPVGCTHGGFVGGEHYRSSHSAFSLYPKVQSATFSDLHFKFMDSMEDSKNPIASR
jgi:hypothetical protein